MNYDKQTEALKLALEALEQIARITGARWALENSYAGHLEAITVIREALAEQTYPDNFIHALMYDVAKRDSEAQQALDGADGGGSTT